MRGWLGPRPRGERRGGGGVGVGVGVGARWVSVMDWHGTDATALGCSDSGGRCTPHGEVGAGYKQGQRRALAANSRGRATTGSDGQQWGAGGREQERGSSGVSFDRWARATQCPVVQFISV
jgi:hypothetical protein